MDENESDTLGFERGFEVSRQCNALHKYNILVGDFPDICFDVSKIFSKSSSWRRWGVTKGCCKDNLAGGRGALVITTNSGAQIFDDCSDQVNIIFEKLINNFRFYSQ